MRREISNGYWEVDSESVQGKKYYVDFTGPSCTCKGFDHHRTCKHLRALEPERVKYVQKLREELAQFDTSSRW